MARTMFGYVKHGHPNHDSAEEAARDEIDRMSNSQLLAALSMGLEDLAEYTVTIT